MPAAAGPPAGKMDGDHRGTCRTLDTSRRDVPVSASADETSAAETSAAETSAAETSAAETSAEQTEQAGTAQTRISGGGPEAVLPELRPSWWETGVRARASAGLKGVF